MFQFTEFLYLMGLEHLPLAPLSLFNLSMSHPHLQHIIFLTALKPAIVVFIPQDIAGLGKWA